METKVKVTDIDLEIVTGQTKYVEIDTFRFVQDEEQPFIEVQILDGENYEYLDEIESHAITISQLILKAKKWILEHVEIVDTDIEGIA